MGSAHNDSLDVGRSARNRASTRYPIHFYFNVPLYEYDLHCGTAERIHSFQSRTPLLPFLDLDTDYGNETEAMVWCSSCREYRVIHRDEEPLNKVVSADDLVAFEQDKGILRERIALAIQDAGFLETDAEIAKIAVQFGVPVSEVKRLNAGLKAPEGLSGEPDMCSAGLHEMTPENIKVANGRRRCLACYRERDKEAKARSRARKAAVRTNLHS